MIRPSGFPRHIASAVWFVAIAIAWTWPLARHLSTHIPGSPGDNLAFLWNDWHMRQALARGLTPFHTDRLFAPYGLDLTLHTHTALASWLSATVLSSRSVVFAHNVLILAALWLNGVAAYALAWSRTRRVSASLVAGTIFAGSPYLAGHLLGHVNLLWAWGIPLFALFWLRALERHSVSSAALAGVVVALTGFNDYYYVVYCAVLVVALEARRVCHVSFEPRRVSAATLGTIVALLVVDAMLILAIRFTGGVATTIAGLKITATRPGNLLTVGWALLLILVAVQRRVTLRRVEGARLAWTPMAILAVVAAVALSPVLWRGADLMTAGNYVAPATSWRSGPGGVDTLTFALGNPWNGGFGETVRHVYERLRLDPVEAGGWLGLAPLLLAAMALWGAKNRQETVIWRYVAIVFLIWSLGPWLRVAGHNTGLPLPQNVIAHIPILSNARMPGRALVMVFMALSMLAAVALTAAPRPARWSALALAVIVFDFLPAPYPMTAIDAPQLYATLRNMPDGVVCELPVGVRDGFGAQGLLDDRVLAFQMIHQHPLIGGFAARVPPSIRQGYAAMPVVRSLFLLSEGKAADAADEALPPDAATEALRAAPVRYVVLNRETAPPALTAFVEQRLRLQLVAREGARDLLVLHPSP